ncbi:MAG TPA: BamA/TamA family outer membrane protein [Bacteroidales bacterium]|nr:BamA/TamA family outer membrane protein [Bacteroidales bacterium]
MRSYGQQQNVALLAAGNIAGGSVDGALAEQWKRWAQDSTFLAFVFPGNFYDAKANTFPLQLINDFRSPLLLAPGRSEWDNGRPDGKRVIKNIEDALEEHYRGKVYMPQAACPGPQEVVLNDHLVVILLDTYWWVYKHDRRYLKCGIESDADALMLIQDAIRRHYPDKHVVIAASQALESYGNSGGHFSFRQAVLEAPYPFYRKVLGLRTDHNYPDFKTFRDQMLAMLRMYPNIIYLSSGDDNLQYFEDNGVHHIISGSMVQQSYVNPKRATFGSLQKGFARLLFYPEGESILEFYGTDGKIFQKQLYKRELKSRIERSGVQQFPDSAVSKASDQYNISESNYFWMGKNYRKVWDTEIEAPIFDISTKMGGLQIVKRGGGQQTKSLRLKDEHDREYALRSVEKYAEGALPVSMKKTIAVDVVQDQISASNPYAALVVARLANYAGVFHTNPEIVFIPDDPLLGIYRRDVANQLFLFEERPDGKGWDIASFGYSKNIVSTSKVVEAILKKRDHQVDTEATLRARLFDIWINDWDRHDDQWRWATFKKDGKTIYKPIPRDRDQAFFVNQGIIPWIAARKWLLPKIQGFDDYTENVPGQSYNARYFDRFFLTAGDWNDWLSQIDSLKMLLSPADIDTAVAALPKEIQPLCASTTAATLKTRLNNLEPMARQLYLSLAKGVDITGTQKKDRFRIVAPNNTSLQIIKYDDKEGDTSAAVIYQRTFYASETKKIRIYGFSGDDHFNIEGNSRNKIKTTIVAGDDHNHIVYEGRKAPRYITIYDKKNTKVSPLLRSRLKSGFNADALEYDREAYNPDVVLPGIFAGYNRDDGVFIGGGAIINKYSRYRQQQYKLLGNYAYLTNSVRFYLSGKFIYPLKKLEMNVVADIKAPRFESNYFGMGNESSWQEGKSKIDYYLVRMTQYAVAMDFNKQISNDDAHKAGLELFYKKTDVKDVAGRWVTDIPDNGLDENELKTHQYMGLALSYRINTIANRETKIEEEFVGSHNFPTRGVRLETTYSQFIGLDDVSTGFSKASADFTGYLSFAQRPRVVYAFRVGGEKLFGDYVFHEAATLGQKDNLRGFRQTRFYGDASLYQNIDVRIRLKQFNTYILNGSTGLTLFHDVGRVWLTGENSSKWHQGYGLGLWLLPFDMALISVYYAHSKEDDLINISLKYQF